MLAAGIGAALAAATVIAVQPTAAVAQVALGHARQIKSRATPALNLTAADCLQFVTDTHAQFVTKVSCLPAPLSAVQLWTYTSGSQLSISLPDNLGARLMCIDAMPLVSKLVDDVPVEPLPCIAGNLLGAGSQQWDYNATTGAFKNRATGKCLASALNLSVEAVPLVTRACNGLPNQGWDSIGTSSVSGHVWNDVNKDGARPALPLLPGAEPGMGGVVVHLVDADGHPFSPDISTVSKSADSLDPGHYIFKYVEPGTYRVRVDAPSGYVFTTFHATGVGAGNDSDTDATGMTDQVVIHEPALSNPDTDVTNLNSGLLGAICSAP